MRRLLQEHVDTFEKLKIVELLRKHAGRAWSEDSISKQPRFDDALTADALAELCKSRLVRSAAQSGHLQLCARSPELAAVEALAQELVLPGSRGPPWFRR